MPIDMIDTELSFNKISMCLMLHYEVEQQVVKCLQNREQLEVEAQMVTVIIAKL